jgi:hypothetical protein
MRSPFRLWVHVSRPNFFIFYVVCVVTKESMRFGSSHNVFFFFFFFLFLVLTFPVKFNGNNYFFLPYLYPFHIFTIFILYFLHISCLSYHYSLPLPIFPLFQVTTAHSPQFFYTFIHFVLSSPSVFYPVFLSHPNYMFTLLSFLSLI